MTPFINSILFKDFVTPVQSQAIYRIAFGLFLAERIFFHPIGPIPGLGSLPAEVWYPPWGFGMLLPPPSADLVSLVLITLKFCCALLVFGVITPLASAAVAGLLLLTRTWTYSLGKIDHDILFVIVPVCLGFSRWGSYYSVDAWLFGKARSASPRDAWPFGLLAIAVAFGFCTSGVQKIIGGWLDVTFPAAVGWVVYYGEFFESNAFAYRNMTTMAQLPAALLECFDWLAVFLDLAFVAALFLGRRLFQATCLVALIFHWGTLLLCGIYFIAHVFVYAAFFPMQGLVNGVVAKVKCVWLLGFIAGIIAVLMVIAVGREMHPWEIVPRVVASIIPRVATIGAVAGLFWLGFGFIRSDRTQPLGCRLAPGSTRDRS